MRITKRAERVVDVQYSRTFTHRADPGRGYGFPCDEQGVIDPALNPAARASLDACLSGTIDVIDSGIARWERRYTLPAEGECDRCRRTVILDGFTNHCPCGADYNSSGQLLAAREQWGEETGESLSDILRI